MKTPTSSESGYFYLRISAVSLLCICGVWLAAMSFVPSASAWDPTYGGSPGAVTWDYNNGAPVIGMGWGGVDFQVYRAPTIGTSSAGSYWQYVTVTLYVYYWCGSGWCPFSYDSKATESWMPYGATATFGPNFRPVVKNIPPGAYYWTSFIQIIWYNDMRDPRYPQQAAWENFYPTNPDTTYFTQGTTETWHGNGDMAINKFAEDRHAGLPWGSAWSYNLGSPTGYIYVLQGDCQCGTP
jgi:hypothetical protein